MLIINADDWGRSPRETDAMLTCHQAGRITSVSAMMFMEDSERAAELARKHGVDAGLHLNLSQRYNGKAVSTALSATHEKVVRFMARGKYAILLYHPGLNRAFREVYQAQEAEFVRLYGHPPSHVDGHQHRHLALNLLVHGVIPAGQKVRRSFTFRPGQKGRVNRLYRSLVDRRLSKWYKLTDSFYSLGQNMDRARMAQIVEEAAKSNVELMTHPATKAEFDWLMSDPFRAVISKVRIAPYASL